MSSFTCLPSFAGRFSVPSKPQFQCSSQELKVEGPTYSGHINVIECCFRSYNLSRVCLVNSMLVTLNNSFIQTCQMWLTVIVIKWLLMVAWFTLKNNNVDKYIKLLSYVYSSNLNVRDISLQPLFIYKKLLVKNTTRTVHAFPVAQRNIMIRQCYCLVARVLREGCHM